jgi:hypothetical protein
MNMTSRSEGNIDSMRWWDEKDYEAGEMLVNLITELRSDDEDRIWRHSVLDRIYDGSLLTPVGDLIDIQDGLADGVNFTAPAIDSVRAKVSTSVPSIKISGQGADHSARMKAINLTRYIEAQADALDIESFLSRALLQAMRLGTGIIGTSVENGRVEVEVVPLSEIFVNTADALRGRPRNMYRIKPIGRDTLIDSYPDMKDEIESAPGRGYDPYDSMTDVGSSLEQNSIIEVFEGWHLPNVLGEEGRHVISLRDGTVLKDEEWRHQRFPFAIIYDHAPETGFWGTGTVERVADVQHQIDEMLTQINEQLRIGSRLKIFVPRGGRIDIDQLVSSHIGAIVEYDEVLGSAPIRFQSPDPVSGELIQHLQWLIQQLYMLVGTTQEQASSQRPAGITSGRAMMYHSDLQTQRHVVLASSYRRLARDSYELLIDRAIDLSDEGIDWPAQYTKNSVVKQINWNDVNMDRDQFILQFEAVSPIPNTFAGHLELVESMAAQGTLPPGFVASLIQDPDIVRMYAQLTADTELANRIIEDLMDIDSEMPTVRDEMNLELTADLVRTAMINVLAQADVEDPDFEEVISRFESYLHDIADRIGSNQQVPDASTALATGLPPTGGGDIGALQQALLAQSGAPGMQ